MFYKGLHFFCVIRLLPYILYFLLHNIYPTDIDTVDREDDQNYTRKTFDLLLKCDAFMDWTTLKHIN